MVSIIKSSIVNGLEVTPVEIEVGFSRGMPGVTIVGLPDNAVKESKERIRFAIKKSGFQFPRTKVVINLSPADIKKEGSLLDLPIALGILHHQYHLENTVLEDYLFYGELNLNGEIKHVRGVLNLALDAKKRGFKGIVIPYPNGREASFVSGIDIMAFRHFHEVIEFIQNPSEKKPFSGKFPKKGNKKTTGDFSDIKGQFMAKRVMEIAAAGFHNVLMVGPPGSGKSMISKCLPSILPEMTDEEILETSLIYSSAGLLNNRDYLITSRPFRSPHHTISDVGISGGGSYPAPGEISLSHNGVLFLDELPYFRKTALETLRQPMEDGEITISRALVTSTYPSRFMLVAAMNHYEDSTGYQKTDFWHASESLKRKYYSRISKPLLDRIDLQIEVPKVPIEDITDKKAAEGSDAVKARVTAARNIQLARFRTLKKRIFANGQMGNREIRRYCELNPRCHQLMKQAMDRLGFSVRSYFKILKVARTIADLSGEETLEPHHIQESLQYRSLSYFTSH